MQKGINKNLDDKVLWKYYISDARGVHLRQDDYEVHDVATALKRYFRSLEEPLLTTFLHAKWINTSSECHIDQLYFAFFLLRSFWPGLMTEGSTKF